MFITMKKALTILVALALGMTAFAQYGPRHYSNQGYGPGFGTGHRHGYGYGYFDEGVLEFGITLNHFPGREKNGVSVQRPDRVGFFGEYRMLLGPIVDMGLQLSTTFGKGESSIEGIPLYETRYWQGAPLVMTDINFLPYSGFNPYVGLGIGPGFGYEKNLFTDKGEWTQALVLSPRAGVELFERLRMSVQYQWYLSDGYKFSNVSFGISWAFPTDMGGGGRRPTRR